MNGEFFTGFSPRHIQWSDDSKSINFEWNPEMEISTSWYRTDLNGSEARKLNTGEEKNLRVSSRSVWNRNHDQRVYLKDGSLYLEKIKEKKDLVLLENLGDLSDAYFSHDESAILIILNENLFRYTPESGTLERLTDIRKGQKSTRVDASADEQQTWLTRQQEELFSVLRQKETEKKADEDHKALLRSEPAIKPIFTGKASVRELSISPDDRYLFLLLYEPFDGKNTQIPVYVTESGYTETEPSRKKVGSSYGSLSLNIYNRQTDTLYGLNKEDIPGIRDVPGFRKPDKDNNEKQREFSVSAPNWSDDGTLCFIQLYASDHKDRWIMLLDPSDGSLDLVDRQHDSAWIGGPGIGSEYWSGEAGWLPNSHTIWYQSEESGYSHLYTFDTDKHNKKKLTEGHFEIYDPFISRTGKYWYFTSNETDPGVRHFYRMNLDGSEKIRLTKDLEGNEAYLSPDEKWIALLSSRANRPPELYLIKNQPGQTAVQLTHSTTPEFEAYPWRIPGFITFRASDGQLVHARIYRPEKGQANGAGVIFVHGAGYLQNAHQWWSEYFREYMFHNFLTDQGYTVLDIDYRSSAGYGREWRTGIYRHMGGKDLSDQTDGARYLVEQEGIDPGRIGIYGGSYGGFITLMAMFTAPGVFQCGAALRSVTDWAHYNHGYTSNILNTPSEDSLAYRRSSPVYFAEGLEGRLLMCHGMMDDNVHFQDIVRLSQRLIELGKENWELAVYPLERHSFTEPTSWSDEYRRIYRMFEETLEKD
ncbi:MAG: prolyl oligopeptidase family serine peptidase [Bacteroidota bacterium]